LIVADANILLYLMSPGPFHLQAEALRKKDGDWRVPPVWSLEFSNALARAVRDGSIQGAASEEMMEEAQRLFSRGEVAVSGSEALKAANRYRLSSYDASNVALAIFLNAPLVTEDKEVLVRAGGLAQGLAQALGRA
jgi:predicted nucleic acid-binding protein